MRSACTRRISASSGSTPTAACPTSPKSAARAGWSSPPPPPRRVVSSIATVENYEYGFFWYLYQDGNIQFEVKLTGILSLGALQPGETSKYGTLIAPQLYAPNHQHFFNVRLDLDIDGPTNRVYQLDVLPDEPGPN